MVLMRHYELMVILDPSLDERTVRRRWTRSSTSSAAMAARVEKVDIWGKRRLAYEINKNAEGIYAVIEVDVRARHGRRARPPAGAQRVRAAHQGPAARAEARPAAAPRAEVAMAGETVITVVGNLTADPELRFTPSGAAVANFTVASTPRTFDRQSGEWKDGEALFLRCNVWRQAGRERRRVAHPRHAGDRVRAAQAAVVRDPRGREAHRRRARGRRDRPVAAVRHRQGQPGQPRSDGGGGGGGGGGGSAAARRWRRRQLQAPSDDPWGSAPPAGERPAAADDEPPF